MFSRAKRFEYPEAENERSSSCVRCDRKHDVSFATPKPSSRKVARCFSEPRRKARSLSIASGSSLPPYESPTPEPKPKTSQSFSRKKGKKHVTKKKTGPSIDTMYISLALLKIEERLQNHCEKLQHLSEVNNDDEKERNEKQEALSAKMKELEEIYQKCMGEAEEIEEICKQHHVEGEASSVQQSDLVGLCTSIIEELCMKLVDAEVKNRSGFSFKKFFGKAKKNCRKLLYVFRHLDRIEIDE